MHWIDLVILGLIVLSLVISLFRGFIKEAISLATWIAALVLAWRFHPPLAEILSGVVSSETLRLGLAFGILFIATLIVGGLINFVLGKMVDKTGLTGTDRMLGALFGVARGVLIVGVLVLLAGLTPLPEEPMWSDSLLLGHFERLAIWMRGYLPPDVAENFVYA